ncbi:hypothetical protein SAMN04487846_1640 [Microbacterium sp. cf046]|uniref:hypothetical protein n=1 Tax=Microbacterium sp. cf046 TaxID=1761803 RepID=UPI0008F2859C|nr:hypothetical protein [Microbacterium sp. cf046]SFS03128.1 hypothetical protein SAMN04487846_1640 [Microbacterium sp. cf046]
MIRRRVVTAALILCAAGAMMAGCASGPVEPGSVPTPQPFLDRTPLPSCGAITLAQGDEIPAENLDCLESAGDEGAELSVTRPTTEGDPVTEYYRVLPGGGWEAYLDGSMDRHGGQWWFTDCPDARGLEDLAQCRGIPL